MTPAIILAGAHVWGRDTWDALCPRPLLPITNEPLVRHTLRWLRDSGVRTVAVCANDTTVALQSALGEGAADEVELIYYVDRTPRGPAGCCCDAASLLTGDHCVVVDGSVLPSVDLLAVLRAHVRAGAAATVVADEPEDAVGGEHSLKPAGIYVFARRALELVGPTGYQDIKEVLIPRLRREREPVLAYRARRPTLRVQSLAGYLTAQAWSLGHAYAGGRAPDGYVHQRGALVHESARVDSEARVLGEVMIGPDTAVAPGAIVVGPTVIGGGCAVEADSVVGRSVLWDGCHVASGARVDLCVVAHGVGVPHGAAAYRTVWQGPGTADHGARRERRGASYDLVNVRR